MHNELCMTTVTLLRHAIETEVHVPQGQERFVPETMGWIMDFRRAST